MAQIKPLRGITYNLSKVDLADVTTPPYDIINTQAQTGYYDKSPHNMIRLDLGRKYDSDSDTENRYTRAAALYDDWRNENILVQAPEKTIYVYRQTYELDKTYVQTGIICLVKLEEFGQSILPHEKTLSAPRKDRYQLLEACHANFSPIYALYADESRTMAEILSRAKLKPPTLQMTDEPGTIHEIFPMTETSEISAIENVLSTKRLFIADGHHRYETSLNFCKNSQKSGQAPESYQYMMMYLVDMATEAMTILPTHRVLKLDNFDLSDLLNKLPNDYKVSDPLAFADVSPASDDPEKVTFDLYALGRVIRIEGRRDSLVGLNNETPAPISKRLDTSILQDTIFGPLLDIASGDPRLSFKQDILEATSLVDSDEASLAVFLRSTEMNQIIGVAEAGEKMPQKSTFFYPKPRSGLVINGLD